MIDLNAVAEFLESWLGCEFQQRPAGELAGVILWPRDLALGHLHIAENILEDLDTEAVNRAIEDGEIPERLRDGRSYLLRIDESGTPMFLPLE